MKAIIQTNYQGINGLELAERPLPTVSPVGSLIKVAYTPVLPWDIKSEEGQLIELEQPRLPKVIGYVFSGTIEKKGSLNPKSIGTRVIGASPSGTHSEYIAANIPFYTFKVPDNVSLKAAATLFGGADAALMMIKETGITSGQTTLVVGASGSVGHYLVQLLQRQGIAVTIYSSKRSQDFLKTQFPKVPLVTTSADIIPKHFDVLFDTTGNSLLLQQLEFSLKTKGILFSAGLPHYPAQRQDIRVHFSNRPLLPASYKQLLQALADGSLQAAIDLVYPFERVKEAQHHVKNDAKRGRTLLAF